jgi:hypothetical protein
VVSDLDRSLDLYRALLEPLGYVSVTEIVVTALASTTLPFRRRHARSSTSACDGCAGNPLARP